MTTELWLEFVFSFVVAATSVAGLGWLLSFCAQQPANRKRILLNTTIMLAVLPILITVSHVLPWRSWSFSIPAPLETNNLIAAADTAPFDVEFKESAIVKSRQKPTGNGNTSNGFKQVASSTHWIGWIWVTGVAFSVLGILRAFYRLQGMIHRARPLANIWTQQQSQLQCVFRGRVALLSSDEIAAPMVVGFSRATILFPTFASDELDSETIQPAIEHELAHIAERDHQMLWFLNLVTTIYWFHPVVWLINQRWNRASEEVCDSYVLSTYDAKSYAQTLLYFAESLSRGRSPSWRVGLSLLSWRLEDRIRGFWKPGRSRMNTISKPGTRLALVAVVVVAVCTSALGVNQRKGQSKRNPPGQPATTGKSNSNNVTRQSQHRTKINELMRHAEIDASEFNPSLILTGFEDSLREASLVAGVPLKEFRELDSLIDSPKLTLDQVLKPGFGTPALQDSIRKLSELRTGQKKNKALLEEIRKRTDLNAKRKAAIIQLARLVDRGSLTLSICQRLAGVPNKSSSWTELRKSSLGPEPVAMIRAAIDSPFPIKLAGTKTPEFSAKMVAVSGTQLTFQVDIPGEGMLRTLNVKRDDANQIEVGDRTFRFSYGSTYVHRASERTSPHAHIFVALVAKK